MSDARAMDGRKGTKERLASLVSVFRRRAGPDGRRDDAASGKASERRKASGRRYVDIGADPAMESRHVIRFARRRIAAGLFWQMADPVRSPAEQSAEIGKRTGRAYHAYVSHPEGSQMAPVELGEGVEAGLPAGATMFDPALGPQWIGAFQVSPTHYWIVAIRDAAIISDAIAEYDQAWSDFNDLLHEGEWASILAPPDWNIAGARSEPLASLLTEEGSRIRHLSLLRAYWKRLLLVALLFAAILAGWHGYSWWDETQRQAEIERQRAAQARKNLAALSPPWTAAPLPMDFFLACRSAFAGALFDAPGWTQEKMSCTYAGEGKATVETSWSRNMGLIHLLRMMRPDPHADTPVLLDRKGERAGMTFDIDVPPRPAAASASGGVEPWPAEAVERRILERFQVMGLSIRMIDRGARPGGSGRRATVPAFGYHEVGFSTSAGVTEHISLFSDVPAASGQSIIFDPRTGVFDIEVRVHHQPVLLAKNPRQK